MSAKVPIVVLASGEGTGFESIAQACASGALLAEVRALVTDQAGAGVLARAERHGIPALVVEPGPRTEGLSAEERRQEHERRILARILPLAPRFLVMAGYMRIVTPSLLDAFRDPKGYCRIVNIHPSLLPSFPGVGGYAQAFRFGVKVAGATVHLVDQDLDNGPICAQEAFSIDDCRSEAEVLARGKTLEQALYPRALSWILPEKFELTRRDRRPCVCPI